MSSSDLLRDQSDLFEQRIAAPEVARSEFRGAGQSARAEARAKAKRTTEDAYRRIALSLEGNGPQTRKELAESCGMGRDSINARAAELRDPKYDAYHRYPDWRLVTDGRRGGESILHLARLRPLLARPLTPEETAP